MTFALALTMTTIGLQRFTAAQLGGDIDLRVAEVGFTDTAFVTAPTLTALPGEFRRVSTVSGEAIGDNVVHMIVRDDAAMRYQARGFGLFLADGTLFAVYGQADRIVEKAVASTLLFAIDVVLPTAEIAAITFGDANFLNPPATTMRAGVVELATSTEAIEGTDTLKAVSPSAMQAALALWLPIGAISLWAGAAADVPARWAICDGRIVQRSDGSGPIKTPDLRDRVAVGAGGAHAAGDTFGADEKTVQTGAAGAYTPSGKLPGHSHTLPASTDTAMTGVTVDTPSRKTDTAGGGTGSTVETIALTDPGHSHAIGGSTGDPGPLALSMDPVPAHQHAVTVDVRQPSLSLFFIMRI